MRIFFREAGVDYRRYAFPYQVLAEVSPGEDLAAAYASGFLPASHDPAERRLLFYLARSLRLDLSRLVLAKKRRYLQRRGAEAGLRLSLETKVAFLDRARADWQETVLAWVEARAQPSFLSPARLAFLLDRPFLREVGVVRAGDQWVGLVLLPAGPGWAHYWFAFYDPAWQPERSLGKWILGETARQLTDGGAQHLYVGTCYGARAHYKFQGFEDGAEFFDGEQWSADRAALTQRLAGDLS
ncbi:MAG: GNAT family N-acetyltransferase [Verrucomicrobiota bacterium]